MLESSDPKSAFASKVNWAAAATAAVALAASFGLNLDEQTKTLILTAAPVVGGALIIVLRTWFTRKRIG